MKDLQFRGSIWYLAEDVDRKLEAVKTLIEEERPKIARPPQAFNEVKEAWVHWFMDEIVKILEAEG